MLNKDGNLGELNLGTLGGDLMDPSSADGTAGEVGLLGLMEDRSQRASLLPVTQDDLELEPIPQTIPTSKQQPSPSEPQLAIAFDSSPVSQSVSLSTLQSTPPEPLRLEGIPEVDPLIGSATLESNLSDDNFALHLTFDEVINNEVSDLSPNGQSNPGVLENGATVTTINSVLGNAVQLDGIDDFVSLADSVDINLGNHAKRTLGLWFRLDELGPAGTKQVIYEEGAGARGLSIYADGDRLYVGGWNQPESDWQGTFLSTDTIQAGQWHHVALVLDAEPEQTQVQAGAFSAYLDGTQFGEGEGSQLWEHESNIGLGAVNQGTRFHDQAIGGTGSAAMKGAIAEVRLYNRVLSDAEIATLANLSLPVFEDAIVHLALDDVEGTTAIDQQSADGLQSGTLVNGAAFASGPGLLSGVVQFDGQDDYVALEDSPEINLGNHHKRSIAVWFKADVLPTGETKQVIYEEGGGARGLNIYLQDQQLYVGGWNIVEGDWAGTFLSTHEIQAGTWHHVSLVLDAEENLQSVQPGAFAGYLDGVQFGTGDGAQLWSHGSDIGLGAVVQNTRFHDGPENGTAIDGFDGDIGDFQLYNRALSAADVATLATPSTVPPATPSLTAALLVDSAPGGQTNQDGMTRNPEIAGRLADHPQGSQLWAGLNGQPLANLSDLLESEGQFTLTESTLETLLGSSLRDQAYQLILQSRNEQGQVLATQSLDFALDRTTPSLRLDSPLVQGIHSPEGRLVGHIADGNEIASATYQLDGAAPQTLTLNPDGAFNVPLTVNEGLHQLQITVTDQVGNQTQQQLDFSAEAGAAFVAPSGSTGWGGTTTTSAVLGESDSLVNEVVLPVGLGQEEGTRTVSFDVQALFDDTDDQGFGDRLSVYLVNAADRSQTLLDMGIPGTPVFSLDEKGAEFQPGLVRYNGTTVELDVTAVDGISNGLLLFQLLNADGDTGTVVRIDQLTSTVDLAGESSPTFPMNRTVVAPGEAISLDGLTPNADLSATLKQVRFDAATGTYRADLQVTNTGEETLGRQVAIALIDLPNGVTVPGASGIDGGNPYFNLRPAITSGGLAPGATSNVIELVIENPTFAPFDWQWQVLSGGINRAPVFEEIAPLTITPGTPFSYKLAATDPDGDTVQYSLRNPGALPTGGLFGDGTLRFSPSPDELGTYSVEIVATDGALETVQTITLQVIEDAISTTRISGVVQTVGQEALAGVVVRLDGYEATTADDGTFVIVVPEGLTLSDDKLWILAGDLTGTETYPSVAEPLPLLLGHDAFTGVNNVIDRPIYLPALDMENAQAVNPSAETRVTTDKIPGAEVVVPPNSLVMISEDGTTEVPFTGDLSITEVPIDLTPAALPPGLVPDVVVTIQPGEMVFNTPAPLSLPNTSGFGPGVLMDLWSINPLTGEFDKVGVGRVSEDGSVVETIDGGINNSSWHFFSPTPNDPRVRDGDLGCQSCKTRKGLSSEVELDSGAVIESHDLVTYESLGVSRGVQLRYDSLRADPRPIVQFGYDDVNPNALAPGFTDKLRLLADLTIHTDEYDYQVPGFAGGQYGLTGGEHFWSISNQTGPVNASLQADLRDVASGVYDYSLNSGIRLFVRDQFVGTSTRSEGQIVHINRRDSAFGAGWGIAGVQELIENSDGSILLIDGDGSELLFDPPSGGVYGAPAGDFSTLEKLPDGTFRRTMKDQMVYLFDDQNRLISMTDRNGNQTQHIYEGDLLVKFIDPVGLETTFGYTNGKVTSITDPANRVTELKYDAAGNLLEIIDPDTTSRVFEYDTRHLMTAETDKRSNREQTVYNFAGRATRGIQKDGSVIQVEAAQMQGLFEADRTTSPFGSPLASGRELGTSTYADQDGKVSRTELDEAGQTIAERDGSGNRGSVIRNEQNLVTQSGDARGFSDFFTYDDRGNILSLREEGLSTNGTLEMRGTSLQFDGVNDYVQLSNSAIIANSPNSTVEAWVKFDSLEGYQLIYSEDTVSGTIYQFALSGGQITLGNINTGDPSGQWRIIQAEREIQTNEWIHVAAVISADEGMKLFINGTLEAFDPISRPSNTNVASVQVGRANNNGGLGYFNGQIDELRVWNTDRNEAQIQLNANRRIIFFEPNLVGYWNFDEGEGLQTTDQTPQNRDGALINGVSWNSQTPELLSENFEFEVVYSEDFENGIGSEWSSSLLDSTYPDIFTTYSGRYSNGSQTLTLQTVPGQVYQLKFDLYALDSWDGSASPGPDYFNVWLNNVLAFHETISFVDSLSFRPRDLGGSFGYNSRYSDSIFKNLNLSFQASNSETQIRFADGGLQGLSDESWGIDNVEISQLNFADAQSAEQFFSYDPIFSQIESHTDELDRQTLYEINPTNGNVLAQTNVVGELGGTDDQITRYTYTPAGQIDRITDPLGRVTDYDYNPLGRLTKITFAQGTEDEATQEFGYDTAGNQTLFIDENGNETRFQYDPLNRLERLTEADPDGDGPLTSPITIFAYDENGNLKSVQDARGNLTTYDYDEQDRQTLMIDALLGEMRYDYDNFGNIVAETDERGHVTRYRYDARNRLIETVDPEGAIAQYAYDLDDNLTSVKELTETWQTLFFEDFENDLSQWVGKTSLNGESSARIVDDPLENDAAVTFDAIASGGDIFSIEGFSDPNNQFRLSFDYLGLPIDGSNEGSYGGFVGFANVTDSAVAPGWNWLAGTDDTSGADPILIDDGLWHRYEIEFTGFSNGDPLFLMLEDHRGVTGDVFFDNIHLEVLPESSVRETRYRYDARNRLVRETDALGETTVYEYDAVNNLTAVEDRRNHRTEYRYDDLDRLIETEDALSQISSQTYDLANNRISSTDELGRTMTYNYDARNRLTRVSHPTPFENESIVYRYDDVGNLRFVTDELNRTTEYRYDGLNRQIEQFDPLRHRTMYEYDANDNLTAIEDALGRRTSYIYDKLNRQTVRTNALGDTTRTSYDPVGNVTAVRDELNRRTTFTYDRRNFLTQVTDPLGHTTTNTYDLLGRTTAERNHLGHTTTYQYDVLDRLIKTEDAIGERTAYTYDAESNLLTLTDAEDNTTSYIYDELDRQISETTAFGTRGYGYDAVSNQTGYVDRNGRRRSYEYDERDRLINESWLDAVDTPIHQIDYSYNAASELTQISDNHSRYSYRYDDAGRLLEVDNQGTPALPNVILNYSYDDVNNMTGVSDTFNGQTQGQETYTYDALDRVTRLTQQGTNVANKRVDFSYDAASQMTGSTRYANLAGTNPVVSSEYRYDLAGRLTDLTHSRGNNTLAFYNWEYDAINRITKATSIDGTNDYVYNDRDELTAAEFSYQDDESYTYDGTGNRTNAGYETGLHNRLLNDGSYSYTYDSEGNRLTRTETATGIIDEYTWDYRNRLTAVVSKDSDGAVIKTAEYTYDAYDHRIEKVVDEDGDGPQGAVTEAYVYDGDHIALVFDGEGNLTHRYLHGPQIDQVLAEETADGEVRWALTDNQGTIRDIIDNDGNVLNHITYDSFGQITEQTNAEAYFRFGYTGREFDTESGQYYYRARYFDPNVGRFISEDPIGFEAGDANLFRYVFNSPLNYTDPLGLFVPPKTPLFKPLIDKAKKTIPSLLRKATPLKKLATKRIPVVGEIVDMLLFPDPVADATFTGNQINCDDEDDDDTISIWKAPRTGQSERLLREGFHSKDFPEGTFPDGYYDGSAYFARERELAEKFASDSDHDDLLLEVQIPEDVYNDRLKSGRIEEEPYYGPGSNIPIGTEVIVPSSEFDMLNSANRILHKANTFQ